MNDVIVGSCFASINQDNYWGILVQKCESRPLLNTVLQQHILLLERIVMRVSSEKIVAFDTIIALIIPVVTALTSEIVMWRKECV